MISRVYYFLITVFLKQITSINFYFKSNISGMFLTKEIDSWCRQLITDHHEWCQDALQVGRTMPCIFGDITKIVPQTTFDKEDNFARKLWKIDHAPFVESCFCHSHHRECPLFGANGLNPDYDISGLPCPDFSKSGLRLRHEGPTNSVFISHAKMHCHFGTPLLVIENVQDTWDLDYLWLDGDLIRTIVL